MKIIIILVVVILSCRGIRYPGIENPSGNKRSFSDSLYYVYKIDSVNNFYLIYAKREKSLYKIVSEKSIIDNCKKVEVRKRYYFSLRSLWKQEHTLPDGHITSPSMVPHLTCLTFDSITSICLERPKINDLYLAQNVKGLCVW